MGTGQNGMIGKLAPYLVEVETKLEFVNVIALNRNMEAKIAQLMDQQTRKPKNVKKIPAQVI